ncbi:histone-lysine N-methyltransferase SETMAR [Trichonephila clavipes]|nr:histone-lysine N-methyltransferase SETMAR [Trichonephila clavipes]
MVSSIKKKPDCLCKKKNSGMPSVSEEVAEKMRHNLFEVHGNLECLRKHIVSYRVLKMEVNEKKIRYILQFFFEKGKTASQANEIVHSVYGVDTETANYVQFRFHRFRSGIFDVKDAPRTGRPVVEKCR